MSRLHFVTIFVLLSLGVLLLTGFGGDRVFWSQWGRNAQHEGMVSSFGQPLNRKLADIVYDPFVAQEKEENLPVDGVAALTAHYQSTLVDDDNSFYMVQKTGTYQLCSPLTGWVFGADCGPNAWNQLIWNVTRNDWKGGAAIQAWIYATDWKPVPNATALTHQFSGYVGLYGWEPVFHPALVGQHLYVPGAGGTVWKVNKQTGKTESQINPFSGMNIDAANTYVAGPLTADENGNIFYNVVELNTNGNPWQQNDVVGAWLAKVAPDDTSATVTFAVLIPNAPPGNSTNCPATYLYGGYDGSTLPWPPAGFPAPPTELCGSQRPPINVAPAVGPDGTVYTVSVAHFDSMETFLVAVNPDLTPKWAASMQNVLTDGCGVLLPIAPQNVDNLPNSCRYGTTVGVDPTTNAKGSATISDTASASPTVLPDGSVLFGVLDNYNHGQGHLLHFDTQGNYINSFTFGWDSTAAVFRHFGTHSIVIKNNQYGGPAYCQFDSPVCTGPPPGPYYISQLDANLNVEWSFENTTINSEHPDGYEWCVNAPVVDGLGVVYASSEDGNVYSIPQGHHGIFKTPRQKIFLQKAIEAAYTPLSIGLDGKVYSQNNGHLFVLGR
jgi:hypothetical protein